MGMSDVSDGESGWTIIRTAIADFLRYEASVIELLEVIRRGAGSLVGISRGLERVAGREDPADDDLHAQAAKAERMLEADLPALHSLALMGMWGALEACINDVCIGWLIQTEGVGARDAMRGVKVPLSDIYFLGGVEKSARAVEWVKANLGSELKQGVGQFESVLERIGVPGGVDPAVRTVLFYAKQIRNLVAHRGGRADRQFVEACPALGLAEGDELTIEHSQMFSILTAMVVYVGDLERRVRTGLDKDPEEAELPPWITSRGDLLIMFGLGTADA